MGANGGHIAVTIFTGGRGGGGGGGGRGGLNVQDVVNVFGEESTLDRRAFLVLIMFILIMFVHHHVTVIAIVAVTATAISCVIVSVRRDKV